MPALVDGLHPGWPMASYRFESARRLSAPVDIGIYFGGRDFGGEYALLRLFQWNGKTYEDITTLVDLPNMIIRGRTDRLSTLVIMRHAANDTAKLK